VTTSRVDAYAQALLEIARTEGRLAEVEDELFRFARTLTGSDDLRLALSDPMLPAERKVGVIEDILGPKALTTTVALALLIVVAGRVGEFEAIVDSFVELAVAERSRELAEVRSAVPLTDDDIDRLRTALNQATGKNVEVKVIVDPSLMGGIVTRVGDLVIDGTVRHRLEQLKEQL
jgi:F-type H+-transporting ATPase subunit delta